MPSTLALPAIYEAIVAKLRADAALVTLLGTAKVYNTPPSGVTFPYIEVGSGTEVPFDTMGPDGLAKWGANTTVQVTARGQSTGVGSDLPLLNIISRAKAVLVGQPLTVTGFPSVDVALETVAPMFIETIDSKPTRTLPMIVRVTVHEGAR